MDNAIESGERKAAGVAPSGRMLLTAMALIVFGISAWALVATISQGVKQAQLEERINAQHETIGEIKAWMVSISRDVQDIARKVGAK